MTLPELLTAKIPNAHITILVRIFYNMPNLTRQESRKRTRFVKWLNKQQEAYAEEQMELIEEFGERDDDGNLIKNVNESGGTSWNIPKAVQDEYTEALKELQKEEVTFGELSTQDLVNAIANISYNYQEPLAGAEAEVFDTFLENFDELFDSFDEAFEKMNTAASEE